MNPENSLVCFENIPIPCFLVIFEVAVIYYIETCYKALKIQIPNSWCCDSEGKNTGTIFSIIPGILSVSVRLSSH